METGERERAESTSSLKLMRANEVFLRSPPSRALFNKAGNQVEYLLPQDAGSLLSLENPVILD